MASSGPISTEEGDLRDRSTKKVLNNSDVNMESSREVDTPPSFDPILKASYKDIVTASEMINLNPEDMVKAVTYDLFPELSNSDDNGDVSTEFIPKPEVSISHEEYENWCKPWKNTLIVKLLGRRISFRFLSTRLQSLWAKEGRIKVLNLNKDFFMGNNVGPLTNPPPSEALSPNHDSIDPSSSKKNVSSGEQIAHDSNSDKINPPQSGCFGPWMIAKKPQRRMQKNQSKQIGKEGSINDQLIIGSRFKVLASDINEKETPVADINVEIPEKPVHKAMPSKSLGATNQKKSKKVPTKKLEAGPKKQMVSKSGANSLSKDKANHSSEVEKQETQLDLEKKMEIRQREFEMLELMRRHQARLKEKYLNGGSIADILGGDLFGMNIPKSWFMKKHIGIICLEANGSL
ncbi:hypothetical protein SESBI_43986 [Sesbania bispinosa]|nr:hypothetical protein SESBI_43986 [Sesbania bispinosa]